MCPEAQQNKQLLLWFMVKIISGEPLMQKQTRACGEEERGEDWSVEARETGKGLSAVRTLKERG